MKRINQFFAAIVCLFTVSTVCNAADRPIPSFQLPEAAKEFVRQNFPGAVIVKIDKKRRGYNVELSNDIELKFNRHGDFLRYDG